jgi:tripartite-type tricarboxylate transporter receptor subunit TctC
MIQMLRLLLGVSALLVMQGPAAQTYPEKPVRLVVGFPPGSQPDTVARLLGQKFSEAWTKPILIENATGAAGNIAAERVARATPDGYTLGLLATAQIVINPSLYKLSFDPVKDFAPVSLIAASPNVLVVHNAVPAKNVQELINVARTRPAELTFASGGSGTSTHMAAELLKAAAGIDIRHVPYKGVDAAMPDLLGGRVTMMFSPTSSVLPLVRDGKLRALAITSLRRASAAPDLPTIAESGYPGFEVTVWSGIFAPARAPAAIVGKLHRETVSALSLPDLRTRLADLGLDPIGNSPDQFAMIIKSESAKWAKVVRDSGMKAD